MPDNQSRDRPLGKRSAPQIRQTLCPDPLSDKHRPDRERTIESPIETPVSLGSYLASPATATAPALPGAAPRYNLSTTVPYNWIPMLPVELVSGGEDAPTNGDNWACRGPTCSDVQRRAAGPGRPSRRGCRRARDRQERCAPLCASARARRRSERRDGRVDRTIG